MRITKQDFLNYLFCPAFAWQDSHTPLRTEEKKADLFKRLQGQEIGRMAREAYPGGILIPELNMEKAAGETERLMNSPDGTVLFEAAFLKGPYAARADILMKENGNWQLFEVKSAVRIKAQYKSDLAYTAMVMQSAGYPPLSMNLLFMNREYSLSRPKEELFVSEDLTKETKDLAEHFLTLREEVSGILSGSRKPEVPFSPLCKNCPGFTGCFSFDLKSHIISLPFLSRKLYESLIGKGIHRIQELPDSLPLNPQQSLMKESLKTGKTVISPLLKEELSKISWPAYYLDFETTMTALPLYQGTVPFEQILTQYSIHKCSAPGMVDEHREYLADPAEDDRRNLAEHLLKDLEETGSIVVYSGFEQRMIRKLAVLFPDLAPSLEKIIPRIADLEKIIKYGIYHPGFDGKSSIKKTLPALVPAMNYDDLAIGDGSTALTAFAAMARGDIPEDQIPLLRRDLLEYCKQDTLGMVKLHETLIRIIQEKENIGL